MAKRASLGHRKGQVLAIKKYLQFAGNGVRIKVKKFALFDVFIR